MICPKLQLSRCFNYVNIFLTLSAFFFIFPAETKSEITTIDVSKAWIRAAPGGAKMLAGYFNIKNTGSSTSSLISITSPHFKKIMMHHSVIDNGVASMSHVEEFTILSGQTKKFAPGGYHLMMMHPDNKVSIGNSLPVKFIFKSGKEITTRFKVRRK